MLEADPGKARGAHVSYASAPSTEVHANVPIGLMRAALLAILALVIALS